MYKNGSILSGILIGLAGWIFCSVGGGLLGAILFSVGLLSVVYMGSFLYTGKAGSWPLKWKTIFGDVGGLTLVLFGNIIGCGIMALVARASGTLDTDFLNGIIQNRESHDLLQVFARGIGCGFLMEIAVWCWREKSSVWGVFFCVPAFILSGFYHSVADAFYYLASVEALGWWTIPTYIVTVLGNFVGCSVRRVFLCPK